MDLILTFVIAIMISTILIAAIMKDGDKNE